MHISVCHLTMFSLCDFTVTWVQLMWVKQMDANMDGMIDFDEFVVATMHMHQLEENNSKKWQSRSSAAFAKLDMDGDGYITADELKVAMGLKSSVSILLDEADTDRDGRISLPEFQKLLHQASLGSRTNHNHPHHRH
jgi:calcium-dependent protein kinase